MAERVRVLAPGGVDLALDVAGSGGVPELIELAGNPEHVITIADLAGAQRYGVRFSTGDSGRAIYALEPAGVPEQKPLCHSSQRMTCPLVRGTRSE